MARGRKTTFDERVEIAGYCIAHDHNYAETAEKYKVSYQQVRNYTVKYEKHGVESLQDKRGIKSTIKYKNNGCTRQAKNPQYIAENLLNREFTAEMPNEKWLTDVTEFHYYMGMEKHKVYLSAILDLYDRRIVSYVINQMGYHPVFLYQFGLCHVYVTSGRAEGFFVFTVCKMGIVHILVGDGAFMDCLFTANADIRGFIRTVAAFPDKVPASLVAGRTGGTLDPTKDDLATDICLTTVISVDAEEAYNVFKGCFGGKSFFNVKPILQSEMFLIARYKIAHDFSFYCCQKARESYHKRIKK